MKNFFKCKCGASAVQYGLLVALIAVAIIVTVTTLGVNLDKIINYPADEKEYKEISLAQFQEQSNKFRDGDKLAVVGFAGPLVFNPYTGKPKKYGDYYFRVLRENQFSLAGDNPEIFLALKTTADVGLRAKVWGVFREKFCPFSGTRMRYAVEVVKVRVWKDS